MGPVLPASKRRMGQIGEDAKIRFFQLIKRIPDIGNIQLIRVFLT